MTLKIVGIIELTVNVHVLGNNSVLVHVLKIVRVYVGKGGQLQNKLL